MTRPRRSGHAARARCVGGKRPTTRSISHRASGGTITCRTRMVVALRHVRRLRRDGGCGGAASGGKLEAVICGVLLDVDLLAGVGWGDLKFSFRPRDPSRCVGLVVLCILASFTTRELDSRHLVRQCRFVGFDVRKHSPVMIPTLIPTPPPTPWPTACGTNGAPPHAVYAIFLNKIYTPQASLRSHVAMSGPPRSRECAMRCVPAAGNQVHSLRRRSVPTPKSEQQTCA
jgi:hypothetical protein